jgi:polyhydroxyalkanoate synthesis regulator phasin
VKLKTLVLPLAASALILAGTGAVLATAGPIVPTQVVAPAADPTATPASGAARTPAQAAPFLAKVLDGLVAKGTITAAQEQSILTAWISQRKAAAQQQRAERQQLRAFLADGVLTEAELAQLPANSPLQALKPLMKNGQLTVADLRALGQGILKDLRLGVGAANGGNGGGQLALPSASPATGG